MATGDLSDADVWGVPAATPSAAPAPPQPVGDSAIPAAPAGTPVGSQPVEINIEKGVSPNAREVDQDVAAADGRPASGELDDKAVWGDQPAFPGAAGAQPHADDLLGLGYGLKRPLDNAAAWVEQGLEKIGVPASGIEHAMGMPSAQDVRAQDERYMADQAAQGRTPGMLGEVAGNMASTAPLLMLPGGAIVQGAATGALGSHHDDLGGIGQDAVVGGTLGKLGELATSAIGRVVQPVIAPYVRELLDAGVKLTPGQIIGGSAKRIEDAATSFPVLGDMIGAGQKRSLESFNEAAINKTLAPIGQSLPGSATSGYAAIDHAHSALSAGYDAVLPKVGVTLDPQLQQNVAKVVEDARNDLSDGNGDLLSRMLDSRFSAQVQPNATMTGEQFKRLDSGLGLQARKYLKSQDPEQQTMGQAITDVQGELRDAMSRQNPAHAPTLDALNQGYANLVRIEKAAGASGAKGGVFTPSQLDQAVRSGDYSVRRNAYARGSAMLQDLSTPGLEVLPSKVPDSGSPFRHFLELTVAGLVGQEAHALPLLAKGAALGAGVGSMYTKAGQKIVTPLLTERPAGAQTVADLLALAKRPISHASASVAPLLQYAGQSPAPPAD